MSLYLVIFILSVIIIALLVWQWRHQRMLSLRVRLIREALRNKDFMFRLPTKRMLPGDRDLHVALNEMFGEINRASGAQRGGIVAAAHACAYA